MTQFYPVTLVPQQDAAWGLTSQILRGTAWERGVNQLKVLAWCDWSLWFSLCASWSYSSMDGIKEYCRPDSYMTFIFIISKNIQMHPVKLFMGNQCVFYFCHCFCYILHFSHWAKCDSQEKPSVLWLFYQSQLSFSAQSHLAGLNCAAMCWIFT